MKSCGPDVAVLALSSGEAKLLWGDGGKRAVLREEHEVSRKAIAQGRPECFRCPVCSCAVLFAQIARGTAGAASTRSSLRPLIWRRATKMQTSGEMRREIAKLYPPSLRAKRSNPCCGIKKEWIASRSLSSGAHSRDPVARNDVKRGHQAATPRAAATFVLDHVAGLPFWSRGCGALPVVACSTQCSKASPHFWIGRHV